MLLMISCFSTQLLYLSVTQLPDILSFSIKKGRHRAPSRNVVYSEPWLKTMFSVSDYELRSNEGTGFLCCEQ